MSAAASDETWMAQALALARKGDIGTAPNPRVGCVLVSDGQPLSMGWHAEVGGPHAEVMALNTFTGDPEILHRATAYVTLEPCSHHGRTPPCVNRLIDSGIQRVVVGMTDPDPRVAGSGLTLLREAGTDVVLMDVWPEGRWLNRRFLSAFERNRPWVVLKCAVSADGYADPIRQPEQKGSLAITHPKLKALTHRWRAEEEAILVGAGTVITDDPLLTVRDAHGPSPMPVVLDPNGRTSPLARLYTERPNSVVIGGPNGLGNQVVQVPSQGPNALLTALNTLQDMGMRSILVEGGPETIRQFLAAGLWDELRLAQSPRTLGAGMPGPELSPDFAQLRGEHAFGEDRVEYWLNPSSSTWVGSCPPPTLSIPLPS